MSSFCAVRFVKASGNAERLLTETVYENQAVDVVPMESGRAWVMLPVSVFAEMAEEDRKRGLPEVRPLTKLDFSRRGLTELTIYETMRVLRMLPGSRVQIIRKGWGREWINTIEKL